MSPQELKAYRRLGIRTLDEAEIADLEQKKAAKKSGGGPAYGAMAGERMRDERVPWTMHLQGSLWLSGLQSLSCAPFEITGC